MLNQSK